MDCCADAEQRNPERIRVALDRLAAGIEHRAESGDDVARVRQRDPGVVGDVAAEDRGVDEIEGDDQKAADDLVTVTRERGERLHRRRAQQNGRHVPMYIGVQTADARTHRRGRSDDR